LKNGEITLGTRHETTIRIQKDRKKVYFDAEKACRFFWMICAQLLVLQPSLAARV